MFIDMKYFSDFYFKNNFFTPVTIISIKWMTSNVKKILHLYTKWIRGLNDRFVADCMPLIYGAASYMGLAHMHIM